MTNQEKKSKLIFKIRKNLGDKYHLYESYDENMKHSWVLYDADMPTFLFYSSINTPIMTSDDSSLEDLYNFSKKHKNYDVHDILHIICNIGLLTAVINFVIIFTNIEYLKGMTFGAMIISFLFELILFNISNVNLDNDIKRIRERIDRREKNEK